VAPKADIQTDVADRVSAVIQTPKRELRIMRHKLSDYEWSVIKPMLPNALASIRLWLRAYGCAPMALDFW
jgi:hypothetical protein